MEKVQELVEEVRELAKEIRRERRANQQDTEQEAKKLFTSYIEKVRAEIDGSYDEPDDEPRPLDDEEAKDQKIKKIMTKMANTILEQLRDDSESESSESDEEEEGSEEESESDEEEQDMEEEGGENDAKETGKGQIGGYGTHLSPQLGKWNNSHNF